MNSKTLSVVFLLVIVIALIFGDTRLKDSAPGIAPQDSSELQKSEDRLNPLKGEQLRTPAPKGGGADQISDIPVAPSLQGDQDPEPVGFVYGQVLSEDGSAVPSRMIQFLKTGRLTGSTTISDDGGFFRIGLAPGGYTAQINGNGAEGEPTWIDAASLTIESIQETRVDLFVFSANLLTGGFYRLDDHGELQDGATLQVEVLLAADTSVCLATVWCSTDQRIVDHYMERLGVDHDPDDLPLKETKYPPGMGYFELPGLKPDLYEIRAYWDVGKKYYVRVIADLRDGDVNFGLEGIRTQDFVSHRVIFDSRDRR